MENSSKTVEILNDLIEINNDRADGFDKAAKDINDVNIDLKAAFDKLSSSSRANVTELAGLVGSLGGEPDTGNTILGTLHRAWIDVKSTFGGSDRASILEECERGEDAILKAYEDALQENELTAGVREILLKQKDALNTSHSIIKGLKDIQS